MSVRMMEDLKKNIYVCTYQQHLSALKEYFSQLKNLLLIQSDESTVKKR